jgi:hypothetical protein
MLKATLRLFNAVQADTITGMHYTTEDSLERSIRNGYILPLELQPTGELMDTIESIIGISGEKANAAFHKSWAVVRDSDIENLVVQQIIHYITTYSFEALGIYDQATVYIPHEKLEIPEIKDDIELVVIKSMNRFEILAQIIQLGSSGIALAEQTLTDIMTIVMANKYEVSDEMGNSFIDGIKNRELVALLNDYYNVVPTEPVAFLRYMISKLTNESLLIKNKYLIEKIKAADGKFLDTLLKDAPKNLASIFFRFKPLFLAMKTISNKKAFFNRLRKDANTMHKPLPEDFLNNVTGRIKNHNLTWLHLMDALEKATIWRKIRLAYALSYRMTNPDSIVYRVRNGMGWATGFNWPKFLLDPDPKTPQVIPDTLKIAFAKVTDSITQDIRENVEGKTIFIPATINYALPATEKQFTGNFPTGSWVEMPKDMIVGIHWFNTTRRIDLDLSVIGVGGKIGWDAAYRTGAGDILFSGDVTNASKRTNGASELFYIKGGTAPQILMVNYFNYEEGDPVPTKILVANGTAKGLEHNYIVNPNNIVVQTTMDVTRKQNVLGLIANNRFYFGNINIGNSITSRNAVQTTQARNYLLNNFTSAIDFKQILANAGAIVCQLRPEDDDYIDLSPTAIDKTTVIELLTKKEETK